MDNYDERMNYSFEPQPEHSAPQPEEHTAPQHEPKKTKGKTGRLIALVVAVALVAGIGGSVLKDVIGSISERNAETQTTMAESPVEPAPGDEADTPSDTPSETGKTQEYTIEKTPLPTTLKSNDGDKSLTPAEVYAMNVDAVVGIRTTGTTNVWGQITSTSTAGSGFVLTADGYIVTNYHVIKGGNSITVAMHNGDEYDATLIGGDETNDIALLKVDAENLQTVTIGNADDLIVGEQVVAIGNPLGELTFTMTQGYISALDREINTSGVPINMLQTDAAINAGNSGGPLFDMNGNVIAITTAKPSSSAANGSTVEGIGFAIPINDVLGMIYDIQENGRVTDKAYLGVTVRDLDTDTAQSYGLPTGVYIASVSEGSCAEKAGIQAGDVMTSIDGKDLASTTELQAELNRKRAGDEVTVSVWRGGRELDLTVTLDEKPAETGTASEQSTQEQQPAQEQPSQNDQNGGSYDPYYEFFRNFNFG